VWLHGNHVDILQKGVWKEKWQCRQCENVFYSPGTTSHIKDHLQTVHNLMTIPTHQGILPGEATTQFNPMQTTNVPNLDPAILKKHLVAWLAIDHIPFAQVESIAWRNFISTCNHGVLDWLPKCADTLRNWTMAVFREKRHELSASLVKMRYRIHISFDAYTSNNCLALLGVVGHWSDDYGNFKRALLGLKEIDGRHTGENLAKCVAQVFNDFGLPLERIGWYILNNAINNDTAVESLIGDEYLSFRLRCVGHIFNLTVKELFSVHAGNDDDDDDDRDDDDVPLCKWKRLSAVAKLHTIAKYILRNPQVKASYRGIEDFGKMIKSDNQTRWNSVDNMIGSVLNKNIAFDKFVRDLARGIRDRKSREKIEAALLTTEEWEQLAELHTILSPFRTLTVMLQGIFPF
jgi:hypothetical protein